MRKATAKPATLSTPASNLPNREATEGKTHEESKLKDN
jgi:hypothetical protein